MNLKLRNVADKGDPKKERLIIRVLNDTDLGEYILLRTGLTDGDVNIGVESTFWFPDKAIQAGDLVVVYSRAGNTQERKADSGRTVHFFYWDQPKAIWQNRDTGVVLAHAPVWESARAEDL
jgi:hypothetical protein